MLLLASCKFVMGRGLLYIKNQVTVFILVREREREREFWGSWRVVVKATKYYSGFGTSSAKYELIAFKHRGPTIFFSFWGARDLGGGCIHRLGKSMPTLVMNYLLMFSYKFL